MLQISPRVGSNLTTRQLECLAHIEIWDLTEVRAQVQARTGWSLAFAEEAIREYRKFLGIVALYPDKRYGMCEIVDEVWHQHILNTRDYAACCETIFGSFIHHDPERISPSVTDLERMRSETVYDLKRVFDEHVSSLWTCGDSGAVSKCCSGHGHVTAA